MYSKWMFYTILGLDEKGIFKKKQVFALSLL